MHIYTREQWGAQYREGWGVRTIGRLNKVKHHSVTTHLDKGASLAQEFAEMRKIERIGQQRFGGGFPYTIAVFPSGRAHWGLGVNRIGTHTGGQNSTAIGIVLVGNYQDTAPTAEQEAFIAWFLNHGVAAGWWKENALSGGHRDYKATSCPGNAAYARIPAINAKADGGSGGYTPPAPSKPAPPATSSAALQLDGSRGPATVKRWQAVMKTTQDGIITQYPKRSSLIKAVQTYLNSVVKAADIRNLIGKPSLTVDGWEGENTIKVLQFWLYNKYAVKVLGRNARLADFDGEMGPETTKLLQFALNLARPGSKRF